MASPPAMNISTLMLQIQAAIPFLNLTTASLTSLVEKGWTSVIGKSRRIRYSCAWLRCSSQNRQAFEPVAGKNQYPRDTDKCEIRDCHSFSAPGFPRCPCINQPEREVELLGEMSADCPGRYSKSGPRRHAGTRHADYCSLARGYIRIRHWHPSI